MLIPLQALAPSLSCNQHTDRFETKGLVAARD
jgi:hypothetical protein